MSMGKGSILSHSLKQKLNTHSSMEAELVGVDDISCHVLWTNYFLADQGYSTRVTVIYQDNKSAILLETNGRASCYQRTKHIQVQ